MFAQDAVPVDSGTLQFGFQNIFDAEGFVIAAAGMTIVFVALILISLFITVLPRLLEALATFLPEPTPHHSSGGSPARDDAVVAAIAWALHQQHVDSSDPPSTT